MRSTGKKAWRTRRRACISAASRCSRCRTRRRPSPRRRKSRACRFRQATSCRWTLPRRPVSRPCRWDPRRPRSREGEEPSACQAGKDPASAASTALWMAAPPGWETWAAPGPCGPRLPTRWRAGRRHASAGVCWCTCSSSWPWRGWPARLDGGCGRTIRRISPTSRNLTRPWPTSSARTRCSPRSTTPLES